MRIKGFILLIALVLVTLSLFSPMLVIAQNDLDSYSGLMGGMSSIEEAAVGFVSYSIEPSTLMPNDEALIHIYITNTQLPSYEADLDSSTDNHIRLGSFLRWDIYSDSTTGMDSQEISIRKVSLSGRGITVINKGEGKTGYNKREIEPGSNDYLPFLIRADQNDGTYFPKLEIEFENGNKRSYPIPIRVDDSSVSISANVNPEIPLKGSSQVFLNVANTRSTPINGVYVVPKMEDGDFTPSQFFIGTMIPDTPIPITFSLSPSSVGKKDITFEVFFKNGVNSHSEQIKTSTNVVDSPCVKLIVVEVPDGISNGDSLNIRLDVANIKSNIIQSVTVIPEVKNADITVPEFYIGTMGPDEVYTVDFNLDAKNITSEYIDMGFKVQYKDQERFYEGNSYNVRINVSPGVSKPSTISSYFSFITVSSVVILSVGGFFVYKRHERDLT